MKTYKNLYPTIYDFENLYRAYRKARRGKRKREQVYRFEFDLENNLLRLQEALAAETYSPGAHTHFYVTVPKRRKISAAPFRPSVGKTLRVSETLRVWLGARTSKTLSPPW